MPAKNRRDRYKTLPPSIDPADTAEGVEGESDLENNREADLNQGAGPYLRTILGPWAR